MTNKLLLFLLVDFHNFWYYGMYFGWSLYLLFVVYALSIYFVQKFQFIIISSYKFVSAVIYFCLFLCINHSFWLNLFTRFLDIEFFHLHTREWFIRWLNWNFFHIEILFQIQKWLRICYLVLFAIPSYFFLQSIYIVRYKRILYFRIFWTPSLQIYLNKIYIYIYIFLNHIVLNRSLIHLLWIRFLWLRNYIFVITRLDLNSMIWQRFQDVETGVKIRGFKQRNLKISYILYLNFLSPFFWLKWYQNSAIFAKGLQFFFLTKLFLIYFISKLLSISDFFIWLRVVCYRYLVYPKGFAIDISFWFQTWLVMPIIILWNFSHKIGAYIRNFILFFLIKLSIIFFVSFSWVFLILKLLVIFIYKIRFILLISAFISIIGVQFLLEMFINLIDIWYKSIYFGVWDSFVDSIVYLNIYKFPYNIISKVVPELFLRVWASIGPFEFPNDLSVLRHEKLLVRSMNFLWPDSSKYDYGLMSWKRLLQSATAEKNKAAKLEHVVLTWKESLLWRPANRNKLTNGVVNIRTELWYGFRHSKYVEETRNLAFFLKNNVGDILFSLDRCFDAEYPRFSYYRALYDSYSIRTIVARYLHWPRHKRVTWWRIRKKLNKRYLVYYLIKLKIHLWFALHMTNDFYYYLVWFTRVFWYVLLAWFDWYFTLKISQTIAYFSSFKLSHLFVFLWNILRLELFTILRFLYFFVIKFLLIAYEIYSIKFFSLYPTAWTFFFSHSNICLNRVSDDFNFIFIYLEDIIVNWLFFSFNAITLWVDSQKYYNILSSLDFLKLVFSLRAWLKSWLDMVYLEYNSHIHRRFTYVLRHTRARRKGFYKNKKSVFNRTGFLKKSSLHRFSRRPNALGHFLLQTTYGLQHKQAPFWMTRRVFSRIRWFARNQRFFRTYDFFLLFMWSWGFFSFVCFKGFRMLVMNRKLEDFNSQYYWHKIRQDPFINLEVIFKKLNKKLIRHQLVTSINNLNARGYQWIDQFQVEIDKAASVNVKKWHKVSLKTVLSKPYFFKWRLRRLKNDVIHNWHHVDFLFSATATANFYTAIINHFELMDLVLSELILINAGKDFWGLYVNSFDSEEDDFGEALEVSEQRIEAYQKFNQIFFNFFFTLDTILYRGKLPSWIWHKDDFLEYYWMHENNLSQMVATFHGKVISAMNPLILAVFFSWYCFYYFRMRSGVGYHLGIWKYAKLNAIFFKMHLWYNTNVYSSFMHFITKAYFRTQSFFPYRAKYTNKAMNYIRRRKLKGNRVRYRKFFFWHFFNRCFSQFELAKTYWALTPLGQWREFFFFKRSIFWISNVEKYFKFFSIIVLTACYIIIRNYAVEYSKKFIGPPEVLSIQEWILHLMYLKWYIYYKDWIRYYYWKKLWFYR